MARITTVRERSKSRKATLQSRREIDIFALSVYTVYLLTAGGCVAGVAVGAICISGIWICEPAVFAVPVAALVCTRVFRVVYTSRT